MVFLAPSRIRTLVLMGTVVACAQGIAIFGAEGDTPDPATLEAEGPFSEDMQGSGSSAVELAPLVVSASRYEEDRLRAPASITVLSSDALIGEGVPSVVASLRAVAGVDVQQAGINRYMVAVRGFNNAFASNTYVLVDHREAYNPALAVVVYAAQPIDALDLERVEVVRGPASALYGPGVEQGVIHFITKDPFKYHGSSLAVGVGEQSMRQASFRHAGVFKETFGYKITGSWMEAEDWKLDPADPHDAIFLSEIVREVRDIDGNVARIVEGRDYGAYTRRISGELHYRFSEETRLTAYVGYALMKQVINASLGEIQIDGPGMLTAQLQFNHGPFWAQAYGMTEFVDGDNFFYRAGHLMYGRSSEINLQAQYQLDLSNGEEPIVFGVDYKRTTPKSRGTISGRFEDEDNFIGVGGYVQGVREVADHLDFKGSVRVDYLGASDDTVVSPRAALVYQATPEHTFRLTYNRALSRPSASDHFNDLQVGRTDAFLIRYMGSSAGFSFPDPPETSSFVGSGRDPGIGLAMMRAYGALTGGVAETLQPEDPTALQAFLASRTPAIEGFSEGIMTFRSPSTGALLGVAESLPEIDELRPPLTDTFEIGYKGVWQDRFLVGIDGYYAKKKDFVFTRVLTPFVEIPADTLRNDLDQAVRAAFTDTELAPFGLDVETLAAGYAAASPGLADRPIGIVEPEQNYNPDTLPEMVLSNLVAGSLDYYGVDLSIEATLNEQWSAFANYSWVSKNFFDGDSLGLPGSGYDVSMNSPKEKVRAGLTYRNGKGLTLSGTLRHISSFRVADGSNYNGVVDAYTLFDLSFNYEFSGSAVGLKLAITAQNVFDDRHREYIGFPMIGRLITSRLTYAF